MDSCSLYFIGCNFRCRGCYWKQIYGKIDYRAMKFLNLFQVMEILKPVNPKRVSILSGDPKPNEEFKILPKVLHDEFGCEVRLLTNGYILPDTEGLEHVSISIKAYTDSIHREYTSKSNRRSLDNIRQLHRNGISLSLSSVFIPNYIDLDEIERIASFIASVDENIPYRVIGYCRVEEAPFREATSPEVERAADLAKRHLKNVEWAAHSRCDYADIVDLHTNNIRRQDD